MKYLTLIALISISLTSFSQDKMNEKRAMNEKHIDFSKEYLYFELTGLIELNGVIFNNDTCNCSIIYKATINTTELINKCTNNEYVFIKFITFGKNKIISISDKKGVESLFNNETPNYPFLYNGERYFIPN